MADTNFPQKIAYALMVFVRCFPALLSSVLLGAHFLRAGQMGLVIFCLSLPLLLLTQRAWVSHVYKIALIAAGFVWIHTGYQFVIVRMQMAQPWLRLAFIIGAVALVTWASSLPFYFKRLQKHFSKSPNTARVSAVVFFLIAITLGFISVKVARPMLLPDRFWPGSGWLLILLLSSYGAYLVEQMLSLKDWSKWRRRLWLFFSLVFFLQLALGLSGFEQFLMSGNLHLPVPAMIVAGPLFRGFGFFMPILFLSTVVLVGPAWCSYLCYIGAWDNYASLSKTRPSKLAPWLRHVRVSILVLVVVMALLLRYLGVSTMGAAVVGLAFGIIGVLVMFFVSRRLGSMVHCVTYCPMGLLANIFGKISPFRIAIESGCNDCGACTLSCRFDALNSDDIARRKPGLSCTLCGDCLGRCRDGQLVYKFGKLKSPAVRAAFLGLVVSLHAVFLAVARL